MIIGITGGIASGKSEVCRILKNNGFNHIDADIVSHDTLEMPEVITEITSTFGKDVLYESKDSKECPKVDRQKLGKIVFNDQKSMALLESITHPYVIDKIKSIINKKKDKNFVIEAIKIVSSGLIDFCDELWVVHAEPEQQIKRMVENRHLSYEDAYDRLASQKIHDWDEEKADRIIYSTEPLEIMEKQVLYILKLRNSQSNK